MQVFWLGAAYISGMIVSLLRLPPLVGYLIAGFVLAGLGYSSGPIIEQIGEAGVLILLFTIGLSIRFKNFKQIEVLGTGFLHLALNTLVYGLIGMLIGLSWPAALLIGLLLAFSSIVLAAKVLDKRGELEAYHGRVAIGILILHIIVGMLVVSFSGGDQPTIWALLLVLLPLIRPILLKTLEWSGRQELQIIYGLLLALGFGLLFEKLNLSAELGAIVAGALLANHKYADELSDKLWGMKEVFLIGFFLDIGLSGFPSLSEAGLMLSMLVFLPIKLLLFLGLLLFFKLRARTAFLTSAAVTSYSGITLIGGAAAVETGWLPESALVALALATALSFAFNALINWQADTIFERIESWLLRFERDAHHPEHRLQTLGNSHFLVVGMGRAGTAAYDWLNKQNLRTVGLDINPTRIERHVSEGRRVVYGDAQDPDLWSTIDLSGIWAIMVTIPHAQTKVNTVKLLRQYGYEGEINALTLWDYESDALKSTGANAICLPVEQAGERLAEISARDNNNQRGADVPLQVKL